MNTSPQVQKRLEAAKDALLRSLNDGVHLLNGTCQIALVNDTPANWNVTIAAAGVRFDYADGTDYTDGPQGVGLESGDAATFVSKKPDGCVTSFVLTLITEIPGEDAETYTYSYAEEPDMCLICQTVCIESAVSLSRDDIKKKGLSVRLRLRRTR
jgi:hypothetical protein